MFADVFLIQPLIDLFEALLVAIHSIGLGWGMSIIVMTLIVRAALLPLTLKQFKSMQSLAKHQPEMKRLQDKYKGDRERLNQEMMKFYKENRINPLASCLPLLAQFPVFISLFYMLRTDLRLDICPSVNPVGTEKPAPCGESSASSFWFIPDLTDKATGSVLIILIVLYVGSQLLSTILSSVSADKTQRMIMLALPFLFVFFVFTFPAGLLVYWITTNLWTIVQQAIVRKRLGPMRPPPGPDDPPPPGLGDLFKRAREGAGAPAPATAKGVSLSKNGGGSSERVSKGRPTGPPPPSPRKKKKRSGRRR